METLSRFRPHPDTEAFLGSIEGIDDDEAGESAYRQPTTGVAEWPAAQRIGHLAITSPAPHLVDAESTDLLDDLDKHPAVRAALDASGLGTPLDPARLDTAIIRPGGPIGRPITQAVSRAVYEWQAGVDGIGYRSRLDPTERCWAIYDHVPVTVTISPLSADDPAINDAVRAVASRFEILLPTIWS